MEGVPSTSTDESGTPTIAREILDKQVRGSDSQTQDSLSKSNSLPPPSGLTQSSTNHTASASSPPQIHQHLGFPLFFSIDDLKSGRNYPPSATTEKGSTAKTVGDNTMDISESVSSPTQESATLSAADSRHDSSATGDVSVRSASPSTNTSDESSDSSTLADLDPDLGSDTTLLLPSRIVCLLAKATKILPTVASAKPEEMFSNESDSIA